MGLQYDDAAWAYFALSALSIFLLPSCYSILSTLYRVLRPKGAEEIGAVARTSAEKQKRAKILANARADPVLSSGFFRAQLAVTAALAVVFAYVLVNIKEDGIISSFDPYRILDLEQGAEAKEIKQ
ncbi:hypothetical protein TeGR_g9889, partial [Tetraparma gracilis]